MSISKEDLIKLGFGGSLNLNTQSQFIDDDKITHKSLQNVTLDIINAGTLRNPQPQLILKNKIEGQTNWETYKTYRIPIQFQDNYTNYRVEIPMIGQVSYFAPDEYFFNAEEYDYFQQFYKKNQIYYQNFLNVAPMYLLSESYSDMILKLLSSNKHY